MPFRCVAIESRGRGLLCADGSRLVGNGTGGGARRADMEHVADIDHGLDEIALVLQPGGLFLFDPINRTMLAAIVIASIGESVLRLLPRGTHDPAKVFKPSELGSKLVVRGLSIDPLVGLGPRGLDRRLDVTFGRLPSVQIMDAGHARKAAGTEQPEERNALETTRLRWLTTSGLPVPPYPPSQPFSIAPDSTIAPTTTIFAPDRRAV